MTLWAQDRIYQRTAAGEEALASNDTAIPSDFRKLLRVIERDTHSDVIRGRLRRYSDRLLSDWLSELEEIGFVSSRVADYTQDVDFTLLLESKPDGPNAPEVQWGMENEARIASAALRDAGTYLSPERLRNREPLEKSACETTLLIVEDDPDQLALADLRASMAGYRVSVARNCLEVSDALRVPERSELVDIVLLDVILPDGNGFDVLSAMRRHPRLALLPVIMLTALEGEEDIHRGLALGADGYVTKPYSKRVLEDTIRAVLKQW